MMRIVAVCSLCLMDGVRTEFGWFDPAFPAHLRDVHGLTLDIKPRLLDMP